MNRAFAKADRIGQVERLLLTSQTPLSQAEIARRCSVHRSTVGRLVQSMVDDGIPLRYTDDGLVYIERTAYISKIHLKLHEALAAFLACRLLARYSDKPTSHTVTTLEKLGASLQRVMPSLGQHIGSTSTAVRRRVPSDSTQYQRVLETLTEAWAQGRKVQLWYRPLRSQHAFQHTFAPYFLEPSAIGYGTYALGVAEPPGQLRTRKLERIERVELTDEPFSVPTSFDPNALLAGAWGIWFDEGDTPIQVELRFAGEQAIRRLSETLWHPSQRTERDEQGRLLWTADIDEPLEMLPWIRGWGGACEVLAPAELRDEVVRDVRRLMRAYDLAPAARADGGLVAHTPAPGTDDWHMLVDHLTRVAELARDFATPFGAGDHAYQLGLWHDVGKASPDFQAYLRHCHADPKHPRGGPDHKAAGALLALGVLEPLALLVQGHHGGLTNKTEFRVWLDLKKQLPVTGTQQLAVDVALAALQPLLPQIHPAQALSAPPYVRDERSAEFFLRMLFSTLVDADFLDTEAHRNPRRAAERGSDVTLAHLLERFEQDQQHKAASGGGALHEARQKMYQSCLAAAEHAPGLFRLAMPTGGGKTRAGMGFALRHAARHGKRRVIVAVPYISITEQTARVYRELFQGASDESPVVLEHHSGVSARQPEEADYRPGAVWHRLASENWDAPVIVTTTVQLFESMFGSKTGVCRKLHRLADSVIILDEAQALPPHLLTPILDGLRELCENYGATVVLSTATQPAFESLAVFRDLPAHDIIPDATRYFAALARVRYEWRVDRPLPWADVADLMRGAPQALVVLNTKGDALALLDALDHPAALHLSTLLCGAHRRDVIAEVHRRLRAQAPCLLVSTQVVEAGVDLDFPLVLRALGPLDRIIQAAGRCNREGRLTDKGRVVVFAPAEGALPPGAYRTATDVTRALLQSGPLDLDSPATVGAYFRRIFDTFKDAKGQMDRAGIQALRAEWKFNEVATKFRMIDEPTEDVIVRYERPGDDEANRTARERIARAIDAIRGQSLGARAAYRVLQPYLVAIRAGTAERYRRQGWIEPLVPDGALGIWHGTYDPLRGLVTDDDRTQLVL